MKTLFSLLFVFSLFAGATAQNVSFGISMGLNRSDFDLETDLSRNPLIVNLESEPRYGFNLGVHALIKIANRVKLSPQLLIDFSEQYLESTFSDNFAAPRSLERVQIRTPLDLHLELWQGAGSFYLISGFEYVFNLNSEEPALASYIDLEENFVAGRIGIGGRKDFEKFSMSPEFVLAKSWNDIEGEEEQIFNEVVTDVRNVNLGFSLKFQGLLSR